MINLNRISPATAITGAGRNRVRKMSFSTKIHAAIEGLYCRRRFKTDHLCRLNFDQAI